MRVWGLIAACAVAAGCVSKGDRPSASDRALEALAPAVAPDGLYVESVLLERPVGDPFLDRELWTGAVPLGGPEGAALLAENGLRAAVLKGTPPARFRKLLDSEAETLGARAMTFAQRTDEVVPLTTTIDTCAFGLVTDLANSREPQEFKQARGGVRVRPERLPDGRVRLWCEPEIQHGERKLHFRPTADATGFVTSEELPAEKFPALGFDTPLGPGDYLLVGWFADTPDTLGATLFAATSATGARQRVLVLRARVLNPTAPPDLPPLGPARRPAIAAEASKR